MKTWTFEIEVVTPLFLSGASQETAELRPNTIKDLMRWWYRAAKGEITDVKQNSKEFEIFGSTENAGKFIPRITYRGLNITPSPFRKEEDFEKLPFGVQYLAFPFRPQKSNNFNPHRSQIEPTTIFKFTISFLPNVSLEEEKAVIAAFWLLVFLGGLGSRSRRGFGSLNVNKVTTNFKQDYFKLQFCFEQQTKFPTFFQENLQEALIAIGYSSSIKPANKTDFTTFVSADSKIYLWETSFDNWETALNQAGILISDFRYYRELDDNGEEIKEDGRYVLSSRNKGDYFSTRNFLKDKNRKPTQYKRAAFGLPININYRSLGNKRAIIEGGFKNNTDEDDDHNRRSSPLFIKVLQVSEKQFALLFLYLPAKFLPDGEKLKIKAKNGHQGKEFCNPPNFSIIEKFLNDKVVPNAEEISF